MYLVIYLASILTIIYNSKSAEDLWKNPVYMIVSPTPICVHATIDIAIDLIEGIDFWAFLDYYDDLIYEVQQLYAWHNIKFIVSKTNYWFNGDEFDVGSSLSETFPRYGEYVQNLGNEERTDIHVLLVNIITTDSNIGKGNLNMICTPYSYAVLQAGEVTYWDAKYTARVFTHEVGHVLGLQHVEASDTACKCPWNNSLCIMQPKTFSWDKSFPSSIDSCNMQNLLSNPPICLLDCDRRLETYNPAKCGNNILEMDEECDCGFEEACEVRGVPVCCDAESCTFKQSSYECGEGECCSNCMLKKENICKSSDDECDLDDFCSGTSPYCKPSIRANGLKCANDEAYCYGGKCVTKDYYCKRMFPNSNVTYSEECQVIANYYNGINCDGISSDNLQDIFCGSGSGKCGQVYCNGSINDAYYRFNIGSTECYTQIEGQELIDRIYHVPNGGKCDEGYACVDFDCVTEDNIESKCQLGTCNSAYEECNEITGNCVPNDAKWFSI